MGMLEVDRIQRPRGGAFLVSVLFITLLAGCQDSPSDGTEASAAGSDSAEAVSGEQLIAQPPLGWIQSAASSVRGLRTASFIPEGEDDANWTRMIKFESMTEDPLPDPIEFVELLTLGQEEQCGTFESYATFSGLENGYQTSVNLLICHNDRKTKRSDVTMIKAIRGNDHFYVVSRSKRGPPVVEGTPAIAEEVVAAWSLYLKSIGVCDTGSSEHPCPVEPAEVPTPG